MKVLVMGATGFIGKHLVKELEKGNEVYCFVRKTSNVEGLRNLRYGDVNDKESVIKALEGIDAVYDLIGIGDVSAGTEKEYERFYKINVEGTRNVAEACKEKKIKKMVYLSSTAAMGTLEEADEETECKPETPYQRSKYEAEKMLENYNFVTVIRPSMVYGPGSKNEIYRIYRFAKKGIIPIIGNGKNTIPMIHVEDLARAMTKVRRGKYIATNYERTSLEELIKIIGKSLGKKTRIIKIPKRAALMITPLNLIMSKATGKNLPLTKERIRSMTTNRMLNVNKLRKEGWEQEIKAEDGIRETIRWYENESRNNLP